MRFGFDAKRIFLNETGLGVYSRLLVKSLTIFFPQHDYLLFTPKVNNKPFNKDFSKSPFKVITPRLHFPGWRLFGIRADIDREGVQLYHGLSHEIPVGLHSSKCRKIVTFHDVIFMKHPEFFPFPDREIYKWKWRHSCRNADMLIAVSENTRKDMLESFDVCETRIKVIYQTCDPAFYIPVSTKRKDEIRAQFSLPDEFMLYVGSIIRRKNLLSAVKAIQLLHPSIRVPLVVVGAGKAYKETVRKYVNTNRLNDLVRFIDMLPNSDLPAIYQLARIFIYPSFYEGFGIPILESLASKTPVVTSSRSAMPEAGGLGAVLVEPEDIDSIAAGITRLLEDQEYYDSCIAKGFDHAMSFTPQRQARETMQLYEQVIIADRS